MTTTRDAQRSAPTPSTHGSLDELKKLVHEFDTSMFVTKTADGSLHARPMAIQEETDLLDADVWFVSSIDTAKMDEMARDPQVCITCIKSAGGAYVSISGTARVKRDRALVRQLWKPDWKIWWPDGPDDPQIAFIEVRVERAEYWEPPAGGRVRVLYQMAKSLVKGESADANVTPPKRI